ncbi:hypothetical protein TNCV_3232171 [Trichonephila clavipes]|nr:hypothetical protein TNCV_3232171 [Trichonephila clavipes]
MPWSKRSPVAMRNNISKGWSTTAKSKIALSCYTTRLPDEIGSVIELDVDHAKKINLEADSDDVQKLLDSQYQEVAMEELIEMHEQEQNVEEI